MTAHISSISGRTRGHRPRLQIEIMPFTKYSKWISTPLDGLSLEELMDELSQFFLQSGFDYGYSDFSNPDSLDALRQAIIEKLVEMGRIPQSLLDQWLEDPTQGDAKELNDLIDQLIQRMIEEGWMQTEQPAPSAFDREGQGYEEMPSGSAKFELTDKSIDFLGFRLLRHLLGSLGRSSFGRHETAHFATGVEAYQATKEYEFGDTLNLDISSTLLHAVAREGLGVPLNLEYQDLMVRQAEYESSCSTVLLLDTSHSMILYGEDRFTPAKRVALALSHLIRTQYPGDSLRLVLFHDSAEEVPLKQLARVVVGPYHTNTCEGLRLARRLLMADKKDMRQIVMITDGKPSAITLPTGRIYKNAFGLDPMILEETFKEVATCRKAGILINTFMLASDHYLVDFVKKVTEICRGKAYFTTTVNLGQYILMDYLRKKVETIH
jgi:Ca-activated chloride channel family protein